MLEKAQRERLLDLLDIPGAGRKLILSSVKNAPVRQIKSRGGNVLTYFQSRKMQRAVGTESRHLEFPTAVSHEHNAEVLEYYSQPYHLKFEYIDAEGEVHVIDHTPDFLVITDRGIWFEECKPWSKLERLAKRNPWRYSLDPDERWTAPPLEQWLAEKGIGYRICTEQDIPQQRIENILLLEDYLGPDAPPCPINIASQVKQALAAEPAMPLAALYEKIPCTPEDAFKLIADGELIADIDYTRLSEPTRCRVFRDEAVRSFEHARRSPSTLELAGALNLSVNAQILYDQHRYTVTFVGANKVVLKNDAGEPTEISIETLEELAQSNSIAMLSDANPAQARSSLANYTHAEIMIALERRKQLQNPVVLNRTERRHLQKVATAKQAGSDELIALIPNIQGRGNREPRLSDEQEAAIEHVIREEYLTARAANLKHCHRALTVLCANLQITPPSYPTLIARIDSLSQQAADRSRHGKRVAYQNSEFVHVLYADTPVHGSRAFQYVHMDHTQLDIELISSTTGKSYGRPWLSLAIDAFTRRIVGMYLSYDAPSYRSNMMLLRDIVKRFRRLPQFIVVDNGADFRSHDFECFCEIMQIHVRFRPAGQPRHGAIMERIFGRLHSEYIHNLAGNTKALKNVRQSTGKFLPSRLAEWSLEELYYGASYWAFTYYDHMVHSTIGMSPYDAYVRSVQNSGERSHRIVTLTRDFLILTCPSAGRQGERTVDRQRGVKVHANYFYWCPDFRNPNLHGKKVPVRYDPWDMSTVYVQIQGRWIQARCKALASLGTLTEKERELFSGELRKHYRLANNQEPSVQQLTEYMRTFTPTGVMQLQLERQRENRDLYGKLGIGAVTAPGLVDYLPPAPVTSTPTALDSVPLSAINELSQTNPYSNNNASDLDLPSFDTF